MLRGPAPGTTFPPSSYNLPYYKKSKSVSLSTSQDQRPKCKCTSEPDPSHPDQARSLQESLACYNHDEDYLFEFDIIGSPEREESGDNGRDVDSNTNEVEVEDGRRISVSSDSSSCCLHRKDNGKQVAGFSTMSSQTEGLVDNGRSEGLFVDPSSWKESCASFLGPTGVEVGTPILAANLHQDCPLVSPDSALDEESILDDQDLCIECASEHSYSKSLQETPQDGADYDLKVVSKPDIHNQEQESVEGDVQKLNLKQSIAELIMKDHEVTISSLEDLPIQLDSSLQVPTDNLTKLCCQLEADKHYPNQKVHVLAPTYQEVTVQKRFKLRKGSSLKTSRSSPDLSGVCKLVRFADILGLDLSEVKIFSDEIPRIPKRAFVDLDVDASEYEVGSPIAKTSFPPLPPLPPSVPTSTMLVPLFNQPGEDPHFYQILRIRIVCLENAFIDGLSRICGVVRVLNMSFNKSVTVRWTVNDWRTVNETACKYVQDSSRDNMDQFSFKLVMDSLAVGSMLEFCLKYDCEGEYWDNNGGANYLFQVFPNSGSISSALANSKPIVGGSHSRSFRVPNLSHSPSHHGDDPWLRFL